MSNFRVGQKVVCVDADGSIDHTHSGLQSGNVYTVTAMGARPGHIRVAEATGAYYASRFRPAVTRKSASPSSKPCCETSQRG